MRDSKEIPDGLEKRLIELIGHKKAIHFLEKVDYNYIAVMKKIMWCEVVEFYRKSPFRFIFIALIVIFFIVYYLLGFFSF